MLFQCKSRKAEATDREFLKLSAAYENPTIEPDLELKVTMLNINVGHNKELLANCRILGEYVQYVDRVRKYAAQMDLNDAVERAITECIKERIFATVQAAVKHLLFCCVRM